MLQKKLNSTFTRAPLLVILLVVSTIASAGAIPRDVSLAPLVKQVSPAVVNISTVGTVSSEVEDNPLFQDPRFRRFFGVPDQPQERETASLGSGVIIDAKEGYILTNHHVVDNATEITINLVDGRQFEATLIGSDKASDIAVLKTSETDLTDMPFADSNLLEVGDYVLAMGNPFGLGHTVTSGIVSAKGRSGVLNRQSYEDFIQTDAAINRGNSGGALVNLQGELVGINTAILGPGGNIGIGFAIPSTMIRSVMDQILEYGSVKRGLLGVLGQPLTAELAESIGMKRVQGALIVEVNKNSGAEKAGIKEYDVILEADGRKVENFNDLRTIVGLKRPGEKIDLKVWRDGKTRNVRAELGEGGTTIASVGNRSTELNGATLAEIPENHPLFGEIEGVLVQEVESGSEAARTDLRAGDIITSINRKSISGLSDVREITGDSNRLLLKIRRGNASFFEVLD